MIFRHAQFFKICLFLSVFLLQAPFVFPQNENIIRVTLVKVEPKLDAERKFIKIKPDDQTVKLRAKMSGGGEIELESERALQSVTLTAGEKTVFGYFRQVFAPGEIYYLKIENLTKENHAVYVHNFGANDQCLPVIPDKEEIRRSGSKFIEKDKTITSVLFYADEKGGRKEFAVFASNRFNENLQDDFFSAFGAMALDRGTSTGRAGVDGRLMQAVGKGKSSIRKEQTESFGITVNLGNIYNPLGNAVKPFEYYDSLLKITDCSVGVETEVVRELKMIWLNNRGLANYQASRLTEAKNDYEAALSFLKKLQEREAEPKSAEEAAILSNLAQVYASLGGDEDAKKALELFQTALEKLRRANYRQRDYLSEADESESIILNNIAVVYEFQKNYAKAEETYLEALKTENNPANRAVTLNNLGRVALALGKQIEARDYFDQALKITENNPNNRGSILNSIGLAFMREKKFDEAVKNFAEAVGIFQQTGNRTAQATALSNLMFASISLKNPRLAVFYGKQAVNLLQDVRREITSLDAESQKGFLKNREEVYRVLADLLFEQERVFEGQEVLSMLKQEEYAGFARRSSDEIRGLTKTAELNETEKKVYPEFLKIAEELTAKGKKFDEMRKNVDRDEAEFQKLKAEIETANVALREFFSRLKNEFTKKVEDDAVITPESVETLRAKLRGAGKDVVLLTYFLQPDYFRVIVTTGQTHSVRKIEYNNFDLTGAEVNKKIAYFNSVLQNPAKDPRPLGQELYKIFFAPIEKDITQSGGKILLWSLDGNLRYVPTAALFDGKKYLAERFQNAVVTLGRTTDIFDEPKNDWRVLGFGVSEKYGDFDALPAVRRELDSIVKEDETGTGVLPGRKLINNDFNLKNFRTLLPAENDDGQRFNILHLATHFRLGADNTSSAILLGDGTELSLENLSKDEELGFENLELLTLSACETAVSVDTGDGREVESLGLLAQKKGAKAVLATLWKVADCSTGEFMSEFYENHKAAPKVSKAEILQNIQKQMIEGKITESAECKVRSGLVETGKPQAEAPAFVSEKSKPFAHPYYWSPFVLIGNWR